MKNGKKIGIDARFFGSKDKGFGRYVENLIKNLEKIDGDSENAKTGNQYFIFLNKKREKEYWPQKPNINKVLIRHNSFWPFKTDNKIKKYNLDFLHFTCLPPSLFCRGKFIITIHDFTWMLWPEFRSILKKITYRLIFRRAVMRAEKIIAVSEYVKKEILRIYRINPEKIKVIYEGVN